MKVFYTILIILALLWWSCWNFFHRQNQTFMHDMVTKMYKHWVKNNDLTDGKKYGYFLQLTDTHVNYFLFLFVSIPHE